MGERIDRVEARIGDRLERMEARIMGRAREDRAAILAALTHGATPSGEDPAA